MTCHPKAIGGAAATGACVGAGGNRVSDVVKACVAVAVVIAVGNLQ
ncbi:MAG: hypothetical protein KGS46_00690 [Chloroflexi bacterium]|nr:hypothetical protein [Chloroflexota bacterium]